MDNNITSQAFPDENNYGISKRDYFATRAMQSLITHFLANDLDEVDTMGWMDGLAMDAYSMADAMLKAREEQ